MVNDPVLLWNLDALQPRWKPAGDVFLPEAFPADAARIALHRDGPPREMRQEHRRESLVVRRQVTLGDPVVGKHDLLGMRDHRHFAIFGSSVSGLRSSAS